jgi:hypothetical protein
LATCSVTNIDIALIPPGTLAARYCEGRRFQMALAGNLIDPAPTPYQEFYNQSSKSWSADWLLDNGAWESDTLGPETLLQVARKVAATEIMAPDVINDSLATFEKTVEFLKVVSKLDRHIVAPRIAAIAHGATVNEAMRFVAAIADESPLVKTIAIGRAFSRKVGNPTARLELALAVKRHFGERFKIHLLGFSDEWPTELQHCNSFPGLIRSMDTVAPFTYAAAGLRIESAGQCTVPRPDNYFDLTADDFCSHSLLQHNIAVLDDWGRQTMHEGRI